MDHSSMNYVISLIEQGQVTLDSCNFLSTQRHDISHLKYFSKKESASDTLVFFFSIISKLRTESALAMKSWIDWNSVPKDVRNNFIKRYAEDKVFLSILDKIEHIRPQDSDLEYHDRVDLFIKLNKIPDKDQENFIRKYKWEKDLLDNLQEIEKYEGLDYEENMYKYITEKIILPKKSNNFIPYVGGSICSLRNIVEAVKVSILDRQEKKLILEKLSTPLTVFPDAKLKMMITGTMEDKKRFLSLRDIVKTSLSLYDLNSIIIQLLHALLVMQQFKIMHNDLHTGNILVEKVYPLKQVDLAIGSVVISFKTKYIPKIYDWDRGYCEAVGENKMLTRERYTKLNIRNSFRKSQDYYQLICGLVDKDNKKIRLILDPLLPNPAFNSWYHERDDGDLKIAIPDANAKALNNYSGANMHVEIFNNKKFINMPKSMFEILSGITLAQIRLLAPSDVTERYLVTENVFFRIDDNTITIFNGHQCMAIYDVPSTLLYPLEKLFSNPILLENLTKNLQDLEIKEFKSK